MTAIFGLVLDRPDVDIDVALRSMAAALTSRGPCVHLWSDRGVGVGAVTRHEASPIAREGSAVLVAHARIDDAAALARQLSVPPRAPSSELLMAAYRRWREQVTSKLGGDFAFAVWDGAQRRFFLARDHFGVRPLYFCFLAGGLFAFATEPKAILAVGGVPKEVHDAAIFDALVGEPPGARDTFFTAVERLPPAHHLTVSPGHAPRLAPYWALDPEGPVIAGTASDFAEAFRERFERAVVRRLGEPEELGSLLSGGLDSSSVACMTRRLLPPQWQLRTFTAGFTAVPACDERRYVERIVAQGGYLPTYVDGDQVGPLTRATQLSTHLDGPVLAGNLSLSLLMCEQAQAAGVKVLLDGYDGDTTVSHGKHRLTELARAGRLWSLWRQGRGFAATFGIPFNHRNMAAYIRVNTIRERLAKAPRVRALVHGIREASGMGPLGPLTRRDGGPGRGDGPDQELVSAELLRTVGADRGHEATNGHAPVHRLRTEREIHVDALASGLLQAILESLDTVCGAFGIEPRYPFWDKELIELCVSLPAAAKLDRGWTRVVMRDALDGVLPPEVQWRRAKSNLGPAFHRGLLEVDRELVEQVLHSDTTTLARFVDVPETRERYASLKAAYDQGGPHAVDHLQASRVFRAASVGLWLESLGS